MSVITELKRRNVFKVGAAYLALASPQRSAASVSNDKAIAVLPFVNLSSDPEQEFFSDGITEEILNRLARVSGLQVAARSSAFSFKGHKQDYYEQAMQLDLTRVSRLLPNGDVKKPYWSRTKVR